MVTTFKKQKLSDFLEQAIFLDAFLLSFVAHRSRKPVTSTRNHFKEIDLSDYLSNLSFMIKNRNSMRTQNIALNKIHLFYYMNTLFMRGSNYY
jgi:hypothetical protein